MEMIGAVKTQIPIPDVFSPLNFMLQIPGKHISLIIDSIRKFSA